MDGVGAGGIGDAVILARVDPGGATAEAVAGGGELGGVGSGLVDILVGGVVTAAEDRDVVDLGEVDEALSVEDLEVRLVGGHLELVLHRGDGAAGDEEVAAGDEAVGVGGGDGGGDDLEVVGRGGGLGEIARNSGGSAHAGRGDGGGNSAGVGEHGDDGGAKEGLGKGKAEALGGVGEGGGIGRAISGLTVVSEVTSTTENAGVVLDHELLAADLDEGVGGNGAADVLVGVEVLGAVDEGVDAAEILGVTGVELALAHVGNPVVGDAGVGDLGSVELDGLEDAGVGGEGDGEFGTVVVESANADALGVGGVGGASADAAGLGELTSGGLHGDGDGGGANAGDVGEAAVVAGVGHLAAVEGLGHVLLTEDVIENHVEGAADVGSNGAEGAEVHNGGLVDNAVGVVVEERVDAVLALLEGAVSAKVDGIALAAHGLVLVPEVVGVGLLDRSVEVHDGADGGGGGNITGGALVAVEAVAGAGLAVADALVGALHVEVTLVGVGVGVLLGGTPGVDLGAGDDSGERAGDHAVRVKVALGGVDVGDAEVAGALGAVVALVVLVAAARVLGPAGAVAGAGVGALRGGEAEEREEDTGLHHRRRGVRVGK